MSKKLKSITLVFENVESMVIPADKILAWRIDDITTGLLGIQSDANVHKYNSCKCFEITINNGFLDSIYTAGYEGFDSKTTHRCRLDFSDIAYVELNYKDGTKKSYNVPWHPEEDEFNPYHNPYQHMEANTIVICNDADWEEYKKLNGCVDSDHQNKDISDVEPESKSEPKVGVCDICGKECQCNGLGFINPDGSVYQTWNICDDCAKTIWKGIRNGILSAILDRHSCVENEATILRFLFDNNMIHLHALDEDWLETQLEFQFGLDISHILSRVMDITGR